MINYPPSLPCASRIEGHSATISAGLVRTPMEAGNARQRRTHRVLPHRISLVFMIDQKLYAQWLAWVNVHAWDEYVQMSLPGLAASQAGTDTTPILVRFMSDLSADLVPVHRLWMWRVRVECEYLPTPADLTEVSRWIIGGSPAAPSPEWIDARHPANPSPNWILAGTALAPAWA